MEKLFFDALVDNYLCVRFFLFKKKNVELKLVLFGVLDY